MRILFLILISTIISTAGISQENDPKETYDIVVSFMSQGEGLDYDVYEEFFVFLQVNDSKFHLDETRWGKEGEVDYCMNFHNKKESEQLLKKIEEMAAKSELVTALRNSECVHKK